MSKKFKPGDRARAERRESRRLNPLAQLKGLLSSNVRRSVEITEEHINSVLVVRRGREASFGSDLFSDPAWDIPLELYAAHLGGRVVAVNEVAAAIGTPQTTTARWVAAVSERALVTIELDQLSSRVWVSLSDEGRSKMKKLADQWGSAFVSI